MNSPRPEDRAFLENFPNERRSFVSNKFLEQVRAGLTTPADVARAVRDKCRLYINRYGDDGGRFMLLLTEIESDPAGAKRYAQWCLDWEALTPGEREKLKARKAIDNFQVWAAAQDPTEKQIALLAKLGHTGPVASKAEASRLIDSLLHQPRTQPKTAFGEAVMAAAGLGRAA